MPSDQNYKILNKSCVCPLILGCLHMASGIRYHLYVEDMGTCHRELAGLISHVYELFHDMDSKLFHDTDVSFELSAPGSPCCSRVPTTMPWPIYQKRIGTLWVVSYPTTSGTILLCAICMCVRAQIWYNMCVRVRAYVCACVYVQSWACYVVP